LLTEGLGKSRGFFPPADCHTQRNRQQATDAKARIPWKNNPGVVQLAVGWAGGKSLNPVNSPLLNM